MPKVGKHVLILISALLWCLVGLFLISLTWKWLLEFSVSIVLIDGFIGVLMGLIIAYFGFSKIALKNVNRILQYEKEKVCMWAFQKWTSYLLIAFMMTLGLFMRNASFIPKYVLTPIYIGIGLALFLSSLLYFQEFIRLLKTNHAKP